MYDILELYKNCVIIKLGYTNLIYVPLLIVFY